MVKLQFNETTYEFKYNSNYGGMDLFEDGRVVNAFGISESQFKKFTIVDFSKYVQKHIDFRRFDKTEYNVYPNGAMIDKKITSNY